LPETSGFQCVPQRLPRLRNADPAKDIQSCE
jgi:hypothetical protein